MIQRILILFALILYAAATRAQTEPGRLCVRAFEDRNRNGQLDANEPFITNNVSADLLNENGIVTQTELLENSLWAAQGLLCFQQLEPGNYTINVTSSSFNPTTANTFTGTVNADTFEEFRFGAYSVAAGVISEPNSATSEDASQRQRANLMARLFFSTVGFVLVVGTMTVIGVIIYFGLFRRRLKQRPAAKRAPSMPLSYQTNSGLPATGHPPTGEFPSAIASSQPGFSPTMNNHEIPASDNDELSSSGEFVLVSNPFQRNLERKSQQLPAVSDSRDNEKSFGEQPPPSSNPLHQEEAKIPPEKSESADDNILIFDDEEIMSQSDFIPRSSLLNQEPDPPQEEIKSSQSIPAFTVDIEDNEDFSAEFPSLSPPDEDKDEENRWDLRENGHNPFA